MSVRGLRGAITVERDTPEEILGATRELLEHIQRSNPDMHSEDIASVLFTLTPDLGSAYPALAARQIGWTQVPLMCAQEILVADALPRCIRVLIHWNTDLPQAHIQPVYLRQAVRLRPDLFANNS
jgi:chorismate mutase